MPLVILLLLAILITLLHAWPLAFAAITIGVGYLLVGALVMLPITLWMTFTEWRATRRTARAQLAAPPREPAGPLQARGGVGRV